LIVVDASAVIEVLMARPKRDAVLDRIDAAGRELHAPHVLDVEVAQVLRRFFSRKELTAERGREALAQLLLLPVTRYPHALLLPTIWRLRDNVAAYDAAYIALAEILNAPLVTTDARLARTPGHSATVEVLG